MHKLLHILEWTLIVTLLTLVGWLLYRTRSPTPLVVRSGTVQADQLVARQLEIVDAQGKTRILLECPSEGPRLKLNDTRNEGVLALVVRDGASNIVMRDSVTSMTMLLHCGSGHDSAEGPGSWIYTGDDHLRLNARFGIDHNAALCTVGWTPTRGSTDDTFGLMRDLETPYARLVHRTPEDKMIEVAR